MSIADKLQIIAENEQKVYDKGEERGRMQGFADGYGSGSVEGYTNGYTNGYNDGYSAGKAEGGGGDSGSYEDGFEDGKKAEYDAFWDSYQDHGNRANYSNAFRNYCWTDKCYNPKYPIKAASGNMASMFQNSVLTDTKVPIIHTGGSSTNVFSGASSMVTIRELSVVESTTFSSWFNNCTNLENITITGTIGQDIDFGACKKLSKDSLMYIRGALSTTAVGKTLTVSQEAIDKAFADDPLGWYQIEYDLPNWSFVYK